MSRRDIFPTCGFALAVVRNFDGRYLAVNETKDRGWWLPGGAINFCETFEEGALRETFEEAGMKIKIKGVLRVEHSEALKHGS